MHVLKNPKIKYYILKFLFLPSFSEQALSSTLLYQKDHRAGEQCALWDARLLFWEIKHWGNSQGI